jgi:hypothetical protein
MTVVKELEKYKLDLVGVQEVIWDRGGTESAIQFYVYIYIFIRKRESESYQWLEG